MNRGHYVVMGVAGSGKSLIGVALAQALAIDFIEGDAYHPPENVQRMSRGIALTDDDRRGWLLALAERIGEAHEAGSGLVMTCSALKRSYRDILRTPSRELQFVFLKGPRALIAERLAGRRGHFRNPSLLESQFATLEEPGPDEGAWVCDIRQSPQDIVASLVSRISA
ncbi:MAG TPA: gluconokinase [Gemmatimonadaceae bacterium]|nr:gluconokinase [Gemmatimonadaceae bacterium]